MLNIGEHFELWVKDGDDHDTLAVVVIMTEYITEHHFESYNLPSLTPKNSRVCYN